MKVWNGELLSEEVENAKLLLPSYQVCCNHAFEKVGLDFAGP